MMSKSWPQVALGEVLELKNDAVPVDASATYQIAGVYSFGKGLLARGPLPGTETTYKVFHRLHKDDFVLSQLKAWEGAMARVTAPFDGWYLSPQFPTFRAKPDRLDIVYLDWYCRQSKIWDQLRSSARGMGDRRDSVSPAKFLSAKIPLPPLTEQHRIVARIEELAAKIEEARGLRQQTAEEAEALCRSIVFGDSTAVPTPMYELVKQRGHDVQVKADQTYHFAGVYCFGRGVFRGQKKSGMDFAYKQLGQLKAGNFVYPKLMAWEGALGVVPTECDGLFVSPEFPIFEVIEDRVLPETLDVIFRTPSVWPLLAGESTGTNVRRRRLNPKDFLAYRIPLPNMETQLRLRQVMMKVVSLKRLQTETAAELDAMLPTILDRAYNANI